MDNYYIYLPAEGQLDPYACWAASLKWWLFAAKSISKTQEDILSSYDAEPDGWIGEKTLKTIINDPRWGMTKQVMPASQFKSSVLKKHLEHGPVYVGYTESGTYKKHVNVIYDMDSQNGSTRVACMEPQAIDKGDWTYEGEHQVKSLRDFNRLGTVYLGSLKPS